MFFWVLYVLTLPVGFVFNLVMLLDEPKLALFLWRHPFRNWYDFCCHVRGSRTRKGSGKSKKEP